MNFRIAGILNTSFTRLTGEEQIGAKATAFANCAGDHGDAVSQSVEIEGQPLVVLSNGGYLRSWNLGRIAIKVINPLGDEVIEVFRVLRRFT